MGGGPDPYDEPQNAHAVSIHGVAESIADGTEGPQSVEASSLSRLAFSKGGKKLWGGNWIKAAAGIVASAEKSCRPTLVEGIYCNVESITMLETLVRRDLAS